MNSKKNSCRGNYMNKYGISLDQSNSWGGVSVRIASIRSLEFENLKTPLLLIRFCKLILRLNDLEQYNLCSLDVILFTMVLKTYSIKTII